MPDDPNWPRASAWLAGDHMPDPVATLAVVEVPVDIASLSPSKARKAPEALRGALERFSTWDGDVDVRSLRIRHETERSMAVNFGVPEENVVLVEDSVRRIEADAFAFLGGDNSITRPCLRAIAPSLDRTGLVTLDAHHDLRDTDEGLNNGNPVRALLEDGLPGGNVWQIGIQPFANSPAYAAVAREHGINVVTVDEVRTRGIGTVTSVVLDDLATRTDAIYVDLDLDVLDRAFAPACPGARPGGLMPAELFEAARLAGAHPKVRAVDIVEVDPTRDVADVTVLAAARCLLSFAAGLAARGT
ncbi:MAG TPA: agmatinase family protein [Actinomycetota bacterium]|jgi:formimidoylglutamase